MRRNVLIAGVILPLLLWIALPLTSSGAPSPGARLNEVEGKLDRARGKADRKRRIERAITQDIQGYTRRINGLRSEISVLRGRQNTLQSKLDRERAVLYKIQDDLRRGRARLLRLRAELRESRVVLAERLVSLYKADDPDLLTVVLDADGFADLLERGEFITRVNQQDTKIINKVRRARVEAQATKERLDRLEARQERLTRSILADRDAVAATRSTLAGRQDRLSDARAGRENTLEKVQLSRRQVEGEIQALEKQSARIASQLRVSQSPGSPSAGPVKRGSGRFIWPVNGPVVSPFGQRWGRLHAGVDIAASTGTPIRASDNGRVAIAGWVSGYGNYTCVNHGGGISTCNGHQSRLATSVGKTVSKGEVIGYIGCTGHCFGPHSHFEVRVNGTPVDPMGYL